MIRMGSFTHRRPMRIARTNYCVRAFWCNSQPLVVVLKLVATFLDASQRHFGAFREHVARGWELPEATGRSDV